jgi:hypothetical protein
MHVGGAAIDFYLVLGMPFALRALLLAPTRFHWLAAAALIIVVTYVCLTTFSRGLYLALIISLLVLYILHKLSGDSWTSGSDVYAWRRHANHALMILLAIESFGILFGGTFMLDRLTASQRDCGSRLEHWSESIGLLKTTEDRLFGIGAGRYPAAYSETFPARELPAKFLVHYEDGNQFIELRGPTTNRKLGGLFGIGQKLSLDPGTEYRALLDVRAAQQTRILVKTCFKHLIHETDCRSRIAVTSSSGDWQHLELTLSPTSDRTDSAKPGWFSTSVISSGRSVAIDNIQLLDTESGSSLLTNGNFSNAAARWFLTGQRYFLPWHTDNLYLEVLIDSGLVGLILFLVFCLQPIIRMARNVVTCDINEASMLAAIIGTLSLGVFNSLFDMPRVAFAFIMYCIVIAAQPGTRANRI